MPDCENERRPAAFFLLFFASVIMWLLFLLLPFFFFVSIVFSLWFSRVWHAHKERGKNTSGKIFNRLHGWLFLSAWTDRVWPMPCMIVFSLRKEIIFSARLGSKKTGWWTGNGVRYRKAKVRPHSRELFQVTEERRDIFKGECLRCKIYENGTIHEFTSWVRAIRISSVSPLFTWLLSHISYSPEVFPPSFFSWTKVVKTFLVRRQVHNSGCGGRKRRKDQNRAMLTK